MDYKTPVDEGSNGWYKMFSREKSGGTNGGGGGGEESLLCVPMVDLSYDYNTRGREKQRANKIVTIHNNNNRVNHNNTTTIIITTSTNNNKQNEDGNNVNSKK